MARGGEINAMAVTATHVAYDVKPNLIFVFASFGPVVVEWRGPPEQLDP